MRTRLAGFGTRARPRSLSSALVAAVALAPAFAWGWTPVPVADDPLVRMPGTQPSQDVSLDSSQSCFNCHQGYDPNVEPAFAWQGSMMAQAARDPLYWAALAVAAQDSIYAFGRPNAADLCERCHMSGGWLQGRSDPPNAMMMEGTDFDGVQCDTCHRMFDPFFEATASGAREGDDWAGYWDESNLSMTPSQDAAAQTLAEDAVEAAAHALFNGQPAYDAAGHPALAGYTENGTGQYFVDENNRKRGPYSDPSSPPHTARYSRYHRSKFLCGTCHDVSNPALLNAALAETPPGDGVTVLPSEQMPAHAYHAVERTFSEFILSDFGLPGGAPGEGAFAPGVLTTSHPGNAVASCQDCHMADRTGKACDQGGAPTRPDDSQEHPKTGVGSHELTGGNALIPFILASTVPESPNYDPENAALLDQGPAALTLDLEAGLGLEPMSLLAGVNRALAELKRAATIQGVSYDPATGAASFRIHNHTGHKLITGYPEGRRMFANVRVYQGATLLHEVNPYDAAEGTLKGLAHAPSGPPLGAAESHEDALVYESHSVSSYTGQSPNFHFILATGTHKDNRIPPRGFRIAEAPGRGAEPHWAGATALDYFTPAEYAGGYDEVALALPPGGDRVVVSLYYQSTSREYIEFLRDEINGDASSLASPTPSGEPMAYVVQSDPFFTQLRAWGDTIWSLWEHNKDVPGAAPVLMTQATFAADTCQGQPDGAPCEDGSLCTEGDTCMGGACQGGAAPSCDDQNPCTEDACEAQVGCVHDFNTEPCEDGNLCNGPDVCAFGLCVPGPKIYCYDGDPCTDDACVPDVGCPQTPICGAGGGGGAGGSGGAGGAGGEPATSSGSGAGGSSPTEPAPAEGGCGCRTAGAGGNATHTTGAGLLAALGLLAMGARRRRERP